MTPQQGTSLALSVDAALSEVLGHEPAPDEDLSALDSLERLEVLVTLEEQVDLPFSDDWLVGQWWSTREALTAHLEASRLDGPQS
jgi:acyl carrier protein